MGVLNSWKVFTTKPSYRVYTILGMKEINEKKYICEAIKKEREDGKVFSFCYEGWKNRGK